MLTNNALVTYDDLTTMGLSAKGSPSTGNRIATKQFIIDNYYVQETYLSTYSSNQCPPYQNIIGASIDGFALAVSNDNDKVLLSLNAGNTWSAISQFDGQAAYGNIVKVSSTGQYMLLVANYPYQVYLSSNYGNNWTSIATANGTIYNLAISDNGQYIVYVVGGGSGNVYISNNFGASFSTAGSPGVSSWRGVAMSSSGQYITLTSFNSYIWVSSNYGVSYTAKTAYPSTGWIPVVMSQNGQYQVAGRDTIYRSSNYGSTWTNTGYTVSNGWARLAISGDGQYLLGFCDFDALELFRSTNYGANWSFVTTIGSSGNGNWKCIAIAPDGVTQLVGASGTVWPTNSMWKSTNYGANFSSVSGTNIGWTAVSLSDGIATTTTTTTQPPYYYYYVDRYSCFPCNVTGYNLIARSSVSLPFGLFYNNGSGDVYLITTSTVGSSYDVDLYPSASELDCVTACSL
jgi:hypothetical protein